MKKSKMSICAYCKLHQCGITYRIVKEHGCLNNKKQYGQKQQCKHFRKVDHPIWTEKERIKKRRKKFQAIKKAKIERLMNVDEQRKRIKATG